MDPDRNLYLCKAIETGLSAEYQRMSELTDALCIIGLDNSVIALKQKFGFARNETVISRPAIDGVISHVVNIGLENLEQMDKTSRHGGSTDLEVGGSRVRQD